MIYLHISRFSINLSLKKIFIFLWSIISRNNNKKNFLKKLKSILKTKNIILTSQGRSALYYILKNVILEKKREIIISPYTLPEVIFCIIYAGGLPIFVDINIKTGLIDLEKLQKKINNKTAGVIITHLYNDYYNYNKIVKFIKKKGSIVIEDSAINFGSQYDKKFVGKNSDYVFFSFNLIKNINLFYGGMIYAKNNRKFKEIKKNVKNLYSFPPGILFKQFFLGLIIYLLNIKLIYNLFSRILFVWFEKKNIKFFLEKIYPGKYSKKQKTIPKMYSYNFPDYAASLGLEQLKDYKSINKLRIKKVKEYQEKLSKINEIIIPRSKEKYQICVFLEYPIIIKDNKKKKLYNFLLSKGIYLRNYWYVNTAKYFKSKKNYLNSEYLENNILCLPTHSQISLKYINLICDEIENFYLEEKSLYKINLK